MKQLQLSGLVMVITLLAGACWAQSLPEAARASRQGKKAATKVYTNDDIPESRQLEDADSASGTDSAQNSQDEQSGDQETDAADKQSAKKQSATKGKASADQAERLKQFKRDADEQHKKIADLEREINLMEREHKLRVAAYYADAGTQLRDSKKWFEEERTYQSDLEAKKKDLADAKQKLEDIREQSRKAGVTFPEPE